MEHDTKVNFTDHVETALKYSEDGNIVQAQSYLLLAEIWLLGIKLLRYNFYPEHFDADGTWRDGGRWLDHREDELFQAWRKIRNLTGAERIIDYMEETPHNKEHKSKEGRRRKLDEEIEKGLL